LVARRALADEPDLLARQDAGRDLDLERALAALAVVQRDAFAAAAERRRQRNRDARLHVAAAPRSARPRAAACATAEQRLEEVAEVSLAAAHVREVEIGRVAEVGRRVEFLARPVAARAQVVVGPALGRILQRLVGFVDALELLL